MVEAPLHGSREVLGRVPATARGRATVAPGFWRAGHLSDGSPRCCALPNRQSIGSLGPLLRWLRRGLPGGGHLAGDVRAQHADADLLLQFKRHDLIG